MSKKSNTETTEPTAAQSKAHTDAVTELKALVATLGVTQVLMTVGQHVTRNAEDFEGGIKFGRRCASMAKKVPQLAS